MARLKTTDYAQRISGNIGGMTLRGHLGKTVAYAIPRLRHSRSITQHNRVTNFGQLSWRWSRQLTPAQRAAWDRIAAAPETGRNLYIRENMLRFNAGLGIRDAAPGLRNVIIVPNWVISATTNTTFSINFAPGPLLAGDKAVAMLQNMVSPAVRNPRTWSRMIWVGPGPYGGVAVVPIPAPRQAGSRLFLKMYRVNETQLASPSATHTWLWPA